MRIECAWCGAVMGGLNDPPPVSHGICSPCLAEAMEEIEEGRAVELLRKTTWHGETVNTIWGVMPIGGEG